MNQVLGDTPFPKRSAGKGVGSAPDLFSGSRGIMNLSWAVPTLIAPLRFTMGVPPRTAHGSEAKPRSCSVSQVRRSWDTNPKRKRGARRHRRQQPRLRFGLVWRRTRKPMNLRNVVLAHSRCQQKRGREQSPKARSRPSSLPGQVRRGGPDGSGGITCRNRNRCRSTSRTTRAC
jgi:hypothetical protein